jgi:hypothetical protein
MKPRGWCVGDAAVERTGAVSETADPPPEPFQIIAGKGAAAKTADERAHETEGDHFSEGDPILFPRLFFLWRFILGKMVTGRSRDLA